ncbi:MAG: SDR family NAD(P)-dependent oxidoreductase [Parvibaculaceae bacterium]
MSGKLEGKVAVVTGANSGIGLGIAKRFAAEGAHVFITGRRQNELDAAVKEIGRNVTAVKSDISKLGDLDHLYEVVKKDKGHIDILVANAGGGTFGPLGAISEENFDTTFGINVKGTLFTVQKALPLLKNGASVILTGSTAAVTGSAGFSVYGASKAAIRSFARNWIIDLKDRHIRVNVLVPGPTSTPGFHGIAANEEEDRQFVAAMSAAVPLGRLAHPDEIAAAALFLASDEASFVNGSELYADGGQAQI